MPLTDEIVPALTARPRGAAPGSRVLVAGMLLWVVAIVVFWPAVASFGDDVGYVGEARLLLGGHLVPGADDVGIWQSGVAKYPLFPSLLMSPFVAVWPRAVFALGVGAALLTCWLASRVLASWGDDPAWGLLLLAHPTFVLISRTATADIPMCAFMLGTWWSFRNDRRAATVLWGAALFLIKVTGGVVAVAVLTGELLRRLPSLRQREPAAWAAVRTAAITVALGAVAVALSNLLTTGTVWFGYEHKGFHAFWPSYFPRVAPEHLLTVLLLPPLLILGAIPFVRRRELAPLAVIGGFGGLMCFFVWVDSGTNWIETRVLAPRLILPVVVFLLIGYANLLAGLSRRVAIGSLVARVSLIVVMLASTLAIGALHARQQRPAAQALAAAERLARERGVTDLGVLYEAEKPGVLFSGRVRRTARADATSAVLLCNSQSGSYRAPGALGSLSCTVPGYRVAYQAGAFSVLTREP